MSNQEFPPVNDEEAAFALRVAHAAERFASGFVEGNVTYESLFNLIVSLDNLASSIPGEIGFEERLFQLDRIAGIK